MSAVYKTVESLPSKAQVLSLYHSCLKNSLKFDNYNFREYFLRKSKHEFHKNKSLSDKEAIIKAYNDAVKQFAVLKRQATISQMYHFDKTVVEHEHPVHHSDR